MSEQQQAQASNNSTTSTSWTQSQHKLHSELILNGLQILKTNNILCDVTLIAQNKKFQVHKILLASVSDYFRSMFTSGMKETSQTEIELKGVTSNGLEKLIDILYTSKASFDSNADLFDCISTANHLQCLLVLDYCQREFLYRINCKNFNYFIQMAKLYRMNDCLDKIDLFIINNLAEIINQTKPMSKRFKSDEEELNQQDSDTETYETGFYSLTYEQLLKCLKHDNLKLKEIDLFILTWQWINETFNLDLKSKNDIIKLNDQKSKTKIEIIRSLMKRIRFGLISPHDLVHKVQTINKLILNDKYLRKLVLNALNYHILGLNSSKNVNSKLRSTTSSILIIGGREINPYPCLHDSCFILDLNQEPKTSTIRKTHLSQLPNNLSHMQCVLIETNYLYVIGGCLSQCAHGESAVNTTYKYDPRLNKWSTCNSMYEKRAYFYSCSLKSNSKEFIYSFGGKNKDGSLSSLEKYDIDSNQWFVLGQELPSTYYAHAGAVLNNKAYLTGGYTHGHFTPDLYTFDPNRERFEELRPMNVARGWHSMCVADQRLYVFGGCYLNSSNNQSHQHQHQIAQPITITEYYSIETDQWTIVKPMINLHKEATCLKINNFIYVIGGYNIATKTGQKLISKYDLNNDAWSTHGQLSSGMTGVGLCLANLPCYLVESSLDNSSNLNSSSFSLNHSNLNSTLNCNSNLILMNKTKLNDDTSSSEEQEQKEDDEDELSNYESEEAYEDYDDHRDYDI